VRDVQRNPLRLLHSRGEGVVSIRCRARRTAEPYPRQRGSDQHKRCPFAHPTVQGSGRSLRRPLTRVFAQVRGLHSRRPADTSPRPPLGSRASTIGLSLTGPPSTALVPDSEPVRYTPDPASRVGTARRSIASPHLRPASPRPERAIQPAPQAPPGSRTPIAALDPRKPATAQPSVHVWNVCCGHPIDRRVIGQPLAGEGLGSAASGSNKDTLVHRGRRGDPLFQARRALHTGDALLTARQRERLMVLFTPDEYGRVEATCVPVSGSSRLPRTGPISGPGTHAGRARWNSPGGW